MNHYDTLEVSPNASPEVIRAAYKSLMQRFHPDKHAGDGALGARAAQIAQAYDVLSDAQTRAEYDSDLQQAVASRAAQFAQGDGAGHGYAPEPHAGAAHKGFPAGALWLAVLAVAAAGVWAAVSLVATKADPRAELASIRNAFASANAPEARRRELYAQKLALLEKHPELVREVSAAKFEDMAARTFPLLEAPLVVQISSRAPGGAESTAELTVNAASLLVGSFDAPSLLAHMAKHRDRLIQDLSERLARDGADRFAGPDAEKQLKRTMIESVARSLGADRGQEYPSTYFESPGRYGPIDVLLPEGFKLIQLSSLR